MKFIKYYPVVQSESIFLISNLVGEFFDSLSGTKMLKYYNIAVIVLSSQIFTTAFARAQSFVGLLFKPFYFKACYARGYCKYLFK